MLLILKCFEIAMLFLLSLTFVVFGMNIAVKIDEIIAKYGGTP